MKNRKILAYVLLVVLICLMLPGVASAKSKRRYLNVEDGIAGGNRGWFVDALALDGYSSGYSVKNFGEKNALDGKRTTAWKTDDSDEAWIEINWRLTKGNWLITGLAVQSGWQKNTNSFEENSRPHEVKICINGRTSYAKLRDERGWQSIILRDPIESSDAADVELTILSSYEGDDYYVCISQIDLLLEENSSEPECDVQEGIYGSDTRGWYVNALSLCDYDASTYRDTGKPKCALDGKKSTAWVTDNSSAGVGDWIWVQWNISNKLWELNGLAIQNGYQMNDSYFSRYNRPEEVTIAVNDYTFTAYLLDRDGWQSVLFPESIKVSGDIKVNIMIESSYGSRREAAISQVDLMLSKR